MFRTLVFRFCLISLLILVVSTPVAAQSTWDSHTRTGEYAFAVGDMDRALAEFEEALKLAQKFPPPDKRLETSLGNLARLHEHQSRPDKALPMYQLQVAAAEYRVGSGSSALLQPLAGQARAAMQTGDIPAAEEALTRYRSIAASTGAADPNGHWIALAMLARTCTLQGRDEEALGFQREAISVLESARRPTEGERATALESLAQMELLHGDAEAAETLIVRAVELRTADGEGGSPAEMLTAAARTAAGAGEFDVAERLANRALTAVESEGGDRGSVDSVRADIAWIRVRRASDSLGDLYLGASPGPELDAAYDLLKGIHDTPDSAADPNAVGENLSRLAQVAALRGAVDDCANWQRQLVEHHQDNSPAGSTVAMTAQENLVGLFSAAEASDDAIAANSALITMQETAWGEDSLRLRPALERQLELLTEAKQKKQAKQVKKRLKKL